MQTGWIKTYNSIIDKDNPKDLYKTKNDEAKNTRPRK